MNGANASDRHVKVPFILNNDDEKKTTDTNIRTEKEKEKERGKLTNTNTAYIFSVHTGVRAHSENNANKLQSMK